MLAADTVSGLCAGEWLRPPAELVLSPLSPQGCPMPTSMHAVNLAASSVHLSVGSPSGAADVARVRRRVYDRA